MQTFFTLAASTGVILVVCDLLWLGVVAREFYREKLGHLLSENFLAQPVIIFYILYALGITYFVTYPLREGALLPVVCAAALFGFIAYGTYDLTNHATLREWPLIITLADMAWGSFLTALAAGGGFLVYQKFFL